VRRRGLVGMAIIILVSMLVAASFYGITASEGNITSNDDFFTTSINGEPIIDVDKWTLTVNGTVGDELVLGYQDVLDLEKVTALAAQRCVTGPSDTASWTGVKVSELLRMAGPDPEAREVVFVCADGYTTSLTLDEIEGSGAWLAYEMNGEVLPVQHGFPLRLVVPDFWGYKWAKWVVAMVVIDYDYQGYWEERGWSDDASINTYSDWTVHAALLTSAAIIGGYVAIGGLGASRTSRWAEKVPRFFRGPYHAHLGMLYYLLVLIVFAWWAFQTYDLRGAVLYSFHGRMAALTIIVATAGAVSGLYLRRWPDRRRWWHSMLNNAGYLMILITIILGLQLAFLQ
jgi:hypothetical protein